MVSTELLRHYPFFANFDDEQLRQLAMITDEQETRADVTLFEEDASADYLYLLRRGNIELHHVVIDERGMEKRQDYLVGMINPGEVFGISALVQPFRYTSSAVTSDQSLILVIDAIALRRLCESDCVLCAQVLERIASITRKRLKDTRNQLLAAEV